jgi:1-acyl-sn-glycerol-3-phosphate acyltransferase
MLTFLPAPLVGIISILLYAILTIFWAIILFIATLAMYIIPVSRWRHWWQDKIHTIPERWTAAQMGIIKLTMRTIWDVKGLEKLKTNGWHLMLANHQTWSDILVLHKVFHQHIPSLRFFMKRELLWQLPIAAQACYLLGYPFMKRYSKEFLQQHPELKGKDIAATRKACERFKSLPTTLINFVEGGRFTKQKHQRQNSPYQYLLKPKAGGIAFVIAAMGEQLQEIINVTIVYPDGAVNFWDFLCGRTRRVIVRVDTLPLTPELRGDYENDRTTRVHFQNWMNQLWQDKDELISKQLKENVSIQHNFQIRTNSQL